MTCIRCCFGILEELTKLFVCPNQVGFVLANSRCYRDVNLGKEELHPMRRDRDEGDLARKLFHLLDSERLALAVKGLEKLSRYCHECWWHPHLKLACVNNLAQHFVEIRHHHVLHLLKRNGILSLAQLGASKKDKDGFNSCNHSLLNLLGYWLVTVVITCLLRW